MRLGFIVFALFIDGLQAMLSLTLLGFITGASFIPGAALVAAPVGALLGVVLSFCISVIMGGSLVLFLALNGMFYPAQVMAAFFGEITPGINLLPAWTALAVAALYRKHREEQRAAQEAPQPPAVQKIPALPARTFNDIRVPQAANDNNPAYAQAA